MHRNAQPSPSHPHNLIVRQWGQVRLFMQFIMATQPPAGNCMRIMEAHASKRPLLTWINFAGLHLLHLVPYRDWPGFATWPHYQERGMQTLNTIKTISNMTMFQTTHWVCEDMFRGGYQKALTPSYDPAPCVEWISSRAKLKDVPAVPILRQWCLDATMSAHGSELLYKQEMDLYNSSFANEPRIVLLDAHMMTKNQCWATIVNDGRHYYGLIHKKVEYLLLMIKKFVALKQAHEI